MSVLDSGVEYSIAVPENKKSAQIFHLRVTDTLLQLLAQCDHSSVSFTGQVGQIKVDGEEFPFRMVPEKNMTCLALSSQILNEKGAISQKLSVHHVLNKNVKEKIKQRTKEAEADRKDKKSVLIDKIVQTKKAATLISRPVNITNARLTESSGRRSPSVFIDNMKAVGGTRLREPSYPRGIEMDTPSPPVALSQSHPRAVKTAKTDPTQLKKHLIHILALGPATKGKLEKEVSGQEIRNILKDIADFRSPARFFLKPEFYKEIDLHWPSYTESDRSFVRSAVLKKFDEMQIPENDPLRLALQTSGSRKRLRDPAAPSSQKERKNGDCPFPQTFTSSANQSAEPSPNEQSVLLNGLPSDLLRPAKPVTYGTIQNHEQYKRWRDLFKQKKNIFDVLHVRLEENTKLFDHYGTRYRNCTDPKERETIYLQIRELYQARDPEVVQKMTERYTALHAELTALKSAIMNYAHHHRDS
eukprot:GCRY01001632.1.p1 GENE.GCRY01001632.1~~GCRY01001632.1.p1  ORF type:complete len:471 (+),score=70.63 GCRY01001632.1:137-1549(+)